MTELSPTPTNKKTLLSTLWIYLSVNYIYCDHLGIMEPAMIKGLLTGHVGEIEVNQGFLLAAALLLQVPFLMIVLARVLSCKANRLANIAAAIVLIVVQLGTMGMGTAPSGVYIFYSVVEIIANCLIIRLALGWRATDGLTNSSTGII